MAVTLWSAWAVGLVLVGVPAGVLRAQEKISEKCVFEGTARNSVTRMGVGKVAIRLVPKSGAAGYAASSNAEGTFRFEGVVAGDYGLEASRTGYSWPGVLADASGHAISTLHLTPGQTLAGNDLWFTPDSGISGKVLGADGEPIPDAQITLIAQKWRNGKRVYVGIGTERADDTGVYRCEAVPPGRYFVYAGGPHEGPLAFSLLEAPGKAEMRIAGRYHPDSPQLDGAAAIDVRPGEEITGIDFKLPMGPVFHLTGSAQPPDPAGNQSIGLKRRFKDQPLDWELENAPISKDGKFDLAGVAPGSYYLYSSEVIRYNSVISAKVPVTVNAEDRAGVVAPPVGRFESKGQVRVEGGASGDPIPVQIFFEGSEADEFTSLQRRTEPAADGTFTIRDLTPDRYTIRIANLETGKEGGYYLKSVRTNGVPAPDGELDMTGGAAENVELILSSTVGSVEGTVKWPERTSSSPASPEPAEELTILMIPEKVESGNTNPLTAYLDQDGRFRVTDLEPGSYRAFAVTNYDKGLWRSSEFLRQMAGWGAKFEVAEKTPAHVEVQVLRGSDIRQVEERVQ